MADNPQALMMISLGLIFACVIVIILFIIFVHTMPGKIARKRNNPQAEAIEILSLLGLLLFPLWMMALVWSYIRPITVPVSLVNDKEVVAGSSTVEDKPDISSDKKENEV